MLPENLSAVINLNSWQVPPLWKLIQEKGNISTEEMYRVFNMGIGMVFVVSAKEAHQIAQQLRGKIIGKIIKGSSQVQLVASQQLKI